MAGLTYHVVGPPGTGKTEYLTRQAARVTDERGPDSVLITSLTRAAATEIAGRDTGVARENVGTLHSLCYRAAGGRRLVLDSEKGMRVWNDWVERTNPAWRLSGGFDVDDPGDAAYETAGDEMLARVNVLRHRMVPREDWPPAADAFAASWGRCMGEVDAVDFTGMVECGLMLEHAPGNPAVLIADESQDYTRLEAEVVRRWSAAAETTLLAADPDQSIYGFRGVDARIFIDHPVPAEQRRVLGQSYRVPAAVHALARRVIRAVRDRVDAPYLPTPEPGEVQHDPAARWARPETWVDQVLDRLSRARRDGAAGPRQGVMVLAPCSYMLAPLTALLRRRGVAFGNHYRPKSGAWNPLGRVGTGVHTAADQLLAYLGGDPAAGWSSDQLRAWLPLLRTARLGEGRLAIGAKVAVERLKTDRPTPEQYSDLWRDEADAEAARKRDVGWLLAGCSDKDRRRLEFPVSVLRASGVEALREQPRLTVGTIHCSPGDEKVLTANRGYVEIKDLVPGFDRVYSFDDKCNALLAGHCRKKRMTGYEIEVVSRSYDGDMLTLSTAESMTRVTPNHSLPVRFSQAFMEKYVVYLMRRGDWWRVGMCTSAHRPYRAGGVGGRLATEQGDAGWILKVCETRTEAREQEAIIQARSGVHGLTFEGRNFTNSLSSAMLHKIHEATKTDVSAHARELLRSFGLLEEYPLYTRSPLGGDVVKRNLRGIFQTAACNILDGYMDIGVAAKDFGLHHHNRWCQRGCKKGKKHPTWLPVSVSQERYVGTVYDLSVEKHHHYISGGAIVHNSCKGGEAAHVFTLTALPPRWARDPGSDELARLFYVAVTRASRSLTVLHGDRGGYQL